MLNCELPRNSIEILPSDPRPHSVRGISFFFGHYGDPESTGGEWHAKHSGIVATIDDRGLPATVYNMRVSRGLLDNYDGDINQTRTIEGKEVFFQEIF